MLINANVSRWRRRSRKWIVGGLDGDGVRGGWRIRGRRLNVAGAGAVTLRLLGGVALGVPHHRHQNPLPQIAAAASASTAPAATVAPSVGPTAWPDLPRPP